MKASVMVMAICASAWFSCRCQADPGKAPTALHQQAGVNNAESQIASIGFKAAGRADYTNDFLKELRTSPAKFGYATMAEASEAMQTDLFEMLLANLCVTFRKESDYCTFARLQHVVIRAAIQEACLASSVDELLTAQARLENSDQLCEHLAEVAGNDNLTAQLGYTAPDSCTVLLGIEIGARYRSALSSCLDLYKKLLDARKKEALSSPQWEAAQGAEPTYE